MIKVGLSFFKPLGQAHEFFEILLMRPFQINFNYAGIILKDQNGRGKKRKEKKDKAE